MAGLYVDVPGRQFPIDRDGSIVFGHNSSTPTVLTLGQVQELMNENESVYALSTNFTYHGVLFPQLRTVTGFYVHSAGTAFNAQTSTDTTNGLDGVWTTRASSLTASGSSGTPPYRVSFHGTGGLATTPVLPYTGVKAIRFEIPGQRWFLTMNIYGSIPVGTTPDRLTLWHPTLDQELGAAGLDYGETTRTFTYDKTFRVKNLSATLTANTIVVSTAALYDTSPTVLSQMTLSQGGSFASTQTITSLAPGAISAVCTLRFIVSSTATVAPWRQRVLALAGTWT